jgi:hypothetical protein
MKILIYRVYEVMLLAPFLLFSTLSHVFAVAADYLDAGNDSLREWASEDRE